MHGDIASQNTKLKYVIAILDISWVTLGGGPVKAEAKSILFPAFGGQKSFAVALKWPNGKFEL